MDWLNGLVGAGIFFLGFFIGVLSVKLARKKEYVVKPKGIDTGVSLVSDKDMKETLDFLEQLPEPEEESKQKEVDSK